MLCGACVPLAFAPFGWYPLAIVLPALLLELWSRGSIRQVVRRGLLFGAGMFGAGVSWIFVSIHVYGKAAVPVAVLATLLFIAVFACYPAVCGYFVRRFGGARPRVWALLLFPGIWILLELLRGWLFTGFPWLNIGYSQIDGPLAGYAPLAGVYGVGLLTLVTAGGLWLVLRGPVSGRWWIATIVAVLWACGTALQYVEWTTSRGRPLQIAVVQGNIAQDQKWLAAEQQSTLLRYLELSEPYWGYDVLLWPETAIPMFYHEVAEGFLPRLEKIARGAGTDLVTGIPVLDQEDWQVYNALMSLGASRGFYRKTHLVPFGEYIPLRRLLGGLLEFFTIPLGDFTAGDIGQPLLTAAGYPVGATICYEIAFGKEVIRSLPEAALLLNVSNDGWFGDSLAPHQHLQMARMRALESGRYLLRATNTGISAVVDPGGRLLVTGPQFEKGVLATRVVPLAGATPYVRFGDWPAAVVALLMVVLGARLGTRPK